MASSCTSLRTGTRPRDSIISKLRHVPAARETYRWIGNVEARINPQRDHTDEERVILRSNPQLKFNDWPEAVQDLQTWVEQVKQVAAKEAMRRIGPVPRIGKTHTSLSITVQFSDKVYAVGNNTLVPISAIRFTGMFERAVEELPSTMKVLRKLGNAEPLAGCAISDFGGDFGLIALIISNRRTLELAKVLIADRNKRKIVGQHLRRAPDTDNDEPAPR